MPSWQLLDTLIIPGIGLNIGWTGNVMYEGEIVGELDPKNTTVQELGLYMSGAKRDKGENVNE